MIENLLKDFKKRLIETNFNIENIYFLFTDLEETYLLSETKKIDKIIKEEKYLIFKISSLDLLEIVNGRIHPEDLLFNKKIKISGDISLLT
ncbi:SCP2 sterol-binding domain-containing protein [Acidimicrobiaceae bacterium]|mgnify:FL=1|nr:SCP2 sterol-binding domain-containing protein [Acidimicrobiaceae bacterium]